MIASLRAELLKSRKRWANWILFGILLLLLISFSYLLPYLIFTHPPPRLETGGVSPSVLKRETFPENVLPELLASIVSVGAAIMIIFGGLSSASEYGWLTVQTILVQKPGRTAVLLGKFLNLAIAALVIGLAALGTAVLVSYLLVSVDGSSSTWPSATTFLKGVGALWLQLAVWTAFGMFLGIAFRSTAGAIGGGLVYFFAVEAIIGQLFRQTDVVKEVLKFLPGVNAGAVNSAFPFTIRNPNAVTQLVSAGRGTITLAVYLLVFSILALLIFQRRDVSGS